MIELKCPACGAVFEMERGLVACPFCGGTIDSLDKPYSASSLEPTSATVPTGDKEARMADLMKRYGEAMTRGDHEAAAGFMEEYLRTSVTGLPGFETKEKVDAFVSESMKTFRQGLGSASSCPDAAGETPTPDDGTVLSKGSSGGADDPVEHCSAGAKTEGSSKRGLFDSFKRGIKDVVDIDEIVDDAKDVFGG